MNPPLCPFNNGTMNAGIAGVLAYIAYCDDIAGSIADPANGLSGWSLAWRADQSVHGNYAFIAKTTNQYVVAIRGSETDPFKIFDDFYNWIEQDLNVLTQVPWMYPSDGASMISWGSSLALTDLTELVDSSSGSPVTMLQYLLANAVPNGTPIAVVGHSLGGNLTTVLTPWISYQIQQANETVPLLGAYTFAAPSAGNTSFAQKYDTLLGSNCWRIYNTIDVAPRFVTEVASVASLWLPAPSPAQISFEYDGWTFTLSEFFDSVAFGIGLSEAYYNSSYSQTNLTQGSIALNVNQELDPSHKQNTLLDWLGQAGWQHSLAQYLNWIQGSGATCATTSRLHVAARDEAARRNPKTVRAVLAARVKTRAVPGAAEGRLR